MKRKMISLLLALSMLATMILPVLAADTASAAQKLTEYALEYGVETGVMDGHSVQTRLDLSDNATAFYGWYYEGETDEVVLELDYQDDTCAHGLYLGFNAKTGALSENALYAFLCYFVDSSLCYVYLKGEQLDPATFTKAGGLEYKIDCAEGNQELARTTTDALLDMAMPLWNDFLKETAGVSLSDLGFTAFKTACEHQFLDDRQTPATCETDGLYELVCTDCGEVLEQEVLPALGHSWDEGKITKEATCTEEGEMTLTCTRCDETKAEVIPVLKCTADEFTDVPKDIWYHEAADWAYSNGYITGIGDKFAATKKANRAMLATILYRMAGAPEVEYKPIFKDVLEDDYFADPAMWALENGIIKGTSEDVFSPSKQLTRETAATILYRYAEKLGADMTTTVDSFDFPDGTAYSDWAEDGLKWAVGSGLINGNEINHVTYLDAKGITNRGQIAKILMQFMTLVEIH